MILRWAVAVALAALVLAFWVPSGPSSPDDESRAERWKDLPTILQPTEEAAALAES